VVACVLCFTKRGPHAAATTSMPTASSTTSDGLNNNLCRMSCAAFDMIACASQGFRLLYDRSGRLPAGWLQQGRVAERKKHKTHGKAKTTLKTKQRQNYNTVGVFVFARFCCRVVFHMFLFFVLELSATRPGWSQPASPRPSRPVALCLCVFGPRTHAQTPSLTSSDPRMYPTFSGPSGRKQTNT
jgi:hypothetical protein